MNKVHLNIQSNTEDLPEDIVNSLDYSKIQDLVLAIDGVCQDVEFTETLICDLISSLEQSVESAESRQRMMDFKDFLRNMEYFEED